MRNPVVVVGGGVMGSALAYWLTRLEPSTRVTVVERDPSYEYASSALSAASIRQQFSIPTNVRISQASIAFLRNAGEELGFDGSALLTAFARKARNQGARYVNADVRGFNIHGTRITDVILTDGSQIGCSHVINAAGPWARHLAAMAGVDLPVFARRRTVYVISCPTAMTSFRLLIDPTGFWIRPEGSKFIAGFSPADDADDQPLQPDYGAFEAGLILYDRFDTLDLSELLFERIAENRPLHEANVIG
jgi:glycine/D-amino acid oxidase-like deaminating enzyme